MISWRRHPKDQQKSCSSCYSLIQDWEPGGEAWPQVNCMSWLPRPPTVSRHWLVPACLMVSPSPSTHCSDVSPLQSNWSTVSPGVLVPLLTSMQNPLPFTTKNVFVAPVGTSAHRWVLLEEQVASLSLTLDT